MIVETTSHRFVAGRTVGSIGFGCMGLSWAYGDPAGGREQQLAVIACAIDGGATLLDTSDIYGPFTNEELVGEAARDRHDEVTISTKVGLVPADGWMRPDGRPEHLKAACDASLRRLGTEVIDLYYLHRVDPAVPLAESWGAMSELVAEGKARQLGLCEVDVDQLDQADHIHRVAAVQSELSIWCREPLSKVVPWCEAHEAAFVAYAPLGRGFLTGTIDAATTLQTSDFRATSPRFSATARLANYSIVMVIEEIARGHDATAAQIALAWLLQTGATVIPIPGTTKKSRVRENLDARLVELTADEFARLSSIPEPAQARY